MDFRFTAEDEAFREELRDWLSDHLVGEFALYKGVGGPSDDRHWEIRLAWEKELAADRWLNVTWPAEYGGRGGTATQEIIFQLEHARSGAPYWVGVQGRDLIGPTLLEFGTDAQRKRFLPAIASCEELWGQGFSEPDAGSDLAGLKTRAELDGDEWVIHGQKIWMTFGGYADWMYVLARTDPGGPVATDTAPGSSAHQPGRSLQRKHNGISMLLVPRHQDGVEVRTIRNIAGGHEFCEVFFDGARTAADLVVGELNGGWKVVMGTLGNERAGTTVLPFQASFQREMANLLDLVRSRGLGRDPVVRQRLAQAWCGLRIMRFNNDRLLTAALRSQHPGPESSINKLHWSHWHRDFGELLVDVSGADALIVGDGYELDPMQHTFLNSRAETIYGGASEIQRNIIGERVLGLPKEPR